jgi:zinc protease
MITHGQPLRWWLLLVPFALVAAGAGSRIGMAADVPASDSVTTEAYEAAGVKVIHRITPASEIVAVRLYLLGGSRQLTEGTEGIESLLLRANGNGTRRAMALTGAQAYLDSGLDWTVAGFTALTRDVPAAWDVFATPFLTVPTDSAIDRARDLLLSAARRRYSHPDLRVDALARSMAFRDHPYALDPQGTEQTLSALTTEDLRRYAHDQFVRSRMLLVIVGNVSRGQVESMLQHTLGRLPMGTYVWEPPPEIPKHPPTWLKEHRPLPTNYILGYFVGPMPTDGDYFAFQVATQLLSSQLNRAVRDERSLSYAAYAPFLDRAIPVGGIYASTPAPSDVWRIMRQEIAQLSSLNVPQSALRGFLDQFTLDRLAQQMTNDGQADALGRAQLYFGDYTMADESWKKLRQVRISSIRRIVRDYMVNLRLAYLGDTTLMSGSW